MIKPVREARSSIGLAILFIIIALVALAPRAQAAQVPSEPALSQYRILAGDELDVFVWGEERMQRQVRVQPDGTFSFPLAGTIAAAGRSVTDIAAEVRERIAVNFRSAPPDVTVSVRDASGVRFYVVGKVRAPGSFISNNPISILQALSMAGGAAEFADLKNALVLRHTDNGEVAEPVELTRLMKGARAMKAGALKSPLPVLMSGDVLVVP